MVVAMIAACRVDRTPSARAARVAGNSASNAVASATSPAATPPPVLVLSATHAAVFADPTRAAMRSRSAAAIIASFTDSNRRINRSTPCRSPRPTVEARATAAANSSTPRPSAANPNTTPLVGDTVSAAAVVMSPTLLEHISECKT